jgi:hypothetical protein
MKNLAWVLLLTILISSYEVIPLNERTRLIQISPYEVDTKILRDEFRAFRTQYVILWTVLSAGLIYAVANR